MSILDTNQKKWNTKKTIIVYSIFTIFVFLVNKIYAIFGHGVSSNYMTWMFLYPLIGGVMFFTLIRISFRNVNRFNGYRIFYNIHNSGIALLTIGSLSKGIMEIAGTSSNHNTVFYVAGWSFIAIGLVILFTLTANQKKFLL